MADASSPPRKIKKMAQETEEEQEDLEGFKFTKESRRRKTTYYKGRSHKNSASKVASAKKAKKRRSSFVRGRNERKSILPAASPASNQELYTDIPSDLPLEGRLRMLFCSSLQLAINKLKEESFSADANAPDLNAEAAAAFEHLKDIVSDMDIDTTIGSQALEQERSDLCNQKFEEDTQICQAVGARLGQESKQWDELLKTHHDTTAQTNKEVSEDGSLVPDFLSADQHQLLSGKPSLKHMSGRLETMKQRHVLQVDSVCRSVSILKHYRDTADSFLERQVNLFGDKTLRPITRLGSTKSLLRARLNLPE